MHINHTWHSIPICPVIALFLLTIFSGIWKTKLFEYFPRLLIIIDLLVSLSTKALSFPPLRNAFIFFCRMTGLKLSILKGTFLHGVYVAQTHTSKELLYSWMRASSFEGGQPQHYILLQVITGNFQLKVKLSILKCLLRECGNSFTLCWD